MNNNKLVIWISILITAFSLSACNGKYSVGGNASGVLGNFTLTNNGKDDLVVEDNGSFTFKKKLSNGSSYHIEVKPRSDTSQGHLCEVSGGSDGKGSGKISGADVVSIRVSCVGV